MSTYDAASADLLLANWTRSIALFEDTARSELVSLKARSRDLVKNTGHARGWLHRLKRNVIGHSGIQLQSRVVNTQGRPDRLAIQRIESEWRKWARRGACTVCGQLSLHDVQKLALEHIAKDGEAVIRIVYGFDNGFDFAVQVLDPLALDHDAHREPSLVMGVEQDDWGRPTRYHLIRNFGRSGYRYRRDHLKLPAAQVIHAFERIEAGQRRGIPWLHAAMVESKHLSEYRESELVAARWGANKLATITGDADSTVGSDAETPTELSTPGTIHELPPGAKLEPFDFDHPNDGFKDFEKAVLRDISSSVGMSYVGYANDLEGVSYSSIRQGTLDERDTFRDVQTLLSSQVLQPMFERWLATQVAAGRIPLGKRRLHELEAVKWQGRGWAWVDPKKEAEASVLEVDANLTSRTDLAASRGEDLEEVFRKIQAETELAAQYGINLAATEMSPQPREDDGADDDEA